MNEHLASSVLSQLSANKFFPDALVRYLEDTELQNLSGDALILLVNIFDDQSLDAVNINFTQKLIDAMPFIVDESTLHALISIFTVLLPWYEKTQPEDNPIIREFLDKEQIYKEKLLYLTIRGSMYRLDKSMQTITVLMTNEETKGKFFTDNDYDLIVDCGLRELES